MIDPKSLGSLIPKETIGKLYDDALAGPAKQVGRLGTDVMKAARLLLAPIQALAAVQDRLEPMLERICKRVPEKRRVEPPAEVVGPAIERMRYLSDESELWRMFEEVLTKVMDRDEVDAVHPSFAYLISQLSRDEAWILYLLRDRDFQVVDTMDLSLDGRKFGNRKVEQSDLPTSELKFPEKVDNLYYSHLQSLNLVTWPVDRQEAIIVGNKQVGIRRWSIMQLTDFGRLFVSACVPPDGFEKAEARPKRKAKTRSRGRK